MRSTNLAPARPMSYQAIGIKTNGTLPTTRYTKSGANFFAQSYEAFSSQDLSLCGDLQCDSSTDFRTAASFNHPRAKPAPFWRQLRSAQALVVLLARLGSTGNLRRFPRHRRSWNGPRSCSMHLAVLSA